jgi:hypothetical protein
MSYLYLHFLQSTFFCKAHSTVLHPVKTPTMWPPKEDFEDTKGVIRIHIEEEQTTQWLTRVMLIRWRGVLYPLKTSHPNIRQKKRFLRQYLLTFPEQHLSSPPVFSGVCVTRSLVLCVCFVDRCLSFCTFSFGHCAVCSSSIFWLPLWYLQTLLNCTKFSSKHVIFFCFFTSDREDDHHSYMYTPKWVYCWRLFWWQFWRKFFCIFV